MGRVRTRGIEMDLAGKHIIVTGASTGIGRAAAEKVVALGGKVTVIARSQDKLEAMRAELGGAVHVAPADWANGAALTAALDKAAAFAPVDGVFCNAGIGGTFAPIEAYTDENFDALIAVNMIAHFRTVRHLFPAMKERGKGSIVITGSLASERG